MEWKEKFGKLSVGEASILIGYSAGLRFWSDGCQKLRKGLVN